MDSSGHANGASLCVSVEFAAADKQDLIEGLFQFYAYDFSEFARDGADFAFDAQGRIGGDRTLDEYWRSGDRWPLLIREGDQVAGFALINALSHRGGEIERNMAEFFVARRHRRRGVARQALHQILRLYPGDWEVAVAERNVVALSFWPPAIASAPNVSQLVRVEGDGAHWRGPIWCFHASADKQLP